MMTFENSLSICDELQKYDYLSKDDDFIRVTQWKNKEGFDISINDDKIFSLTEGQVNAIKYICDTFTYQNIPNNKS